MICQYYLLVLLIRYLCLLSINSSLSNSTLPRWWINQAPECLEVKEAHGTILMILSSGLALHVGQCL